MSRGKGRTDRARRTAFDALRAVHADGAYANLALADLLDRRRLPARDAALATELVAGTCRMEGTYDAIIARAAGRPTDSLQPAVVDLLRLGAHQVLAMRIPTRAAVDATVDLARATVGERVTGLVNAVLRKVAARSLDGWLDTLAEGLTGVAALAVRTHHPAWIAQAWVDVLGPGEAAVALAADNVAPRPTLAVRPGLAEVAELVEAGAVPTPLSPYGAVLDGNPGAVAAVREGRAGVQDEGSQLVAAALARVSGPAGPWLDTCAGPGGKSALLAGLARQAGTWLLASEVAPHRAELVSRAVRAYVPPVPVVCADGTRPAWRRAFARVMVDAPCTGLGALRRRPEARWRHRAEDVPILARLQRELLTAAIGATLPGGVVAYVTCSPHPAETVDVVADVVAASDVEVLDAPAVVGAIDCARPDPWGGRRVVQLWPHRHGPDAMFLALLRVG